MSEQRARNHDRRSDESGSTGSFFKGCFVVIVVLGVLGVLGFIALLGTVIVAGAFGGTSRPPSPIQLQEVRLSGSPGAPKLVVVPIEGMIYGAPASSGKLTPLAIASARLEKARKDPNVRGVLLQVDSPGGGITASDILHREIQQFRSGPDGKPVVVCMRDIAASGGYYISVAANRIFAHPTTVTGSIGVMMPLYDATALMDKIGVENESLTTGPYKDMGSPFVEKTDEQKRKEREVLQGIIDSMYERFLKVVAEGRDMEMQNVREVADGRIFTSENAKSLGLIDEIGYQSDAVQALQEITGARGAQLVKYRRVVSFGEMLATFSQGRQVEVKLPADLDLINYARPMYMWLPPRRGNKDE